MVWLAIHELATHTVRNFKLQIPQAWGAAGEMAVQLGTVGHVVA